MKRAPQAPSFPCVQCRPFSSRVTCVVTTRSAAAWQGGAESLGERGYLGTRCSPEYRRS